MRGETSDRVNGKKIKKIHGILLHYDSNYQCVNSRKDFGAHSHRINCNVFLSWRIYPKKNIILRKSGIRNNLKSIHEANKNGENVKVSLFDID